NPYAAVAGDVVLETLELDALARGDIANRKLGKIGETAIRTDRTELVGLGQNLLLRSAVLEGLQYRDIHILRTHEWQGPAFGNRHRFTRFWGTGRNLDDRRDPLQLLQRVSHQDQGMGSLGILHQLLDRPPSRQQPLAGPDREKDQNEDRDQGVR